MLGGSLGLWVGMTAVSLQNAEGVWGDEDNVSWRALQCVGVGPKGCYGRRAQGSGRVTGPQRLCLAPDTDSPCLLLEASSRKVHRIAIGCQLSSCPLFLAIEFRAG